MEQFLILIKELIYNMKHQYIGKRRNSRNRKRKRIVLIAAEGKNKTEVNYFNGFSNKEVKIVFVRGNETDPVKMTKHLCNDYEFYELDKELGDLAYCVVDGDISVEKEKQILEADHIIKKYGSVIVSNPCIEVWFLCHFIGSTKQYSSSEEVVKRLKKFFPKYSKNSDDIYNMLEDKINTAIDNSKNLEKNNHDNRHKLHCHNNQPSTEVYKIVEAIDGVIKVGKDNYE